MVARQIMLKATGSRWESREKSVPNHTIRYLVSTPPDEQRVLWQCEVGEPGASVDAPSTLRKHHRGTGQGGLSHGVRLLIACTRSQGVQCLCRRRGAIMLPGARKGGAFGLCPSGDV